MTIQSRNQESEEKLERLVRVLAEEKLGGVLIGAQHNFAWLACGGSNGVDLSREQGAGALFVRADGKRFVLANRIEMPRLLAEELNGLEFEPIEFGWEEEKASASFLPERARSLLADGAANEIGSDLHTGDAARDIEASLARARYRLTDGEIERFRALGRDAGELIGEVARSLEPGRSEREIARLATDALATRNIRAVVLLVAADERLARFRHPAPTDKCWQKVVMIVIGARRGGLLASLSRIVCGADVPADLRRRTQLTAHVNAELFAATRPGATGKQLYEVAARAYARAGFPGEQHLHHQGGATGYRTREWVAHPQNAEAVAERQAFAWNPSITGTKVEETCIAFADRIEVITTTPGWPQLEAHAGPQKYLLPGVWSQ